VQETEKRKFFFFSPAIQSLVLTKCLCMACVWHGLNVAFAYQTIWLVILSHYSLLRYSQCSII